ncbi:MAG: tail fiber domain-containing protein [Parafilimonas sp.]|nr:tail fiber domain-containing protein [Parafilimonas sp.]
MKLNFLHLILYFISITCSETILAQANQSLSNLTSPTKINQHLLPSQDNKRDLGNANKGWRNIYFTGSLRSGGYTVVSFDVNHINQFIGPLAGNSTTTGTYNIANGYSALSSLTLGSDNIATGYQALTSNDAGYDNVAYGSRALYYNTTGADNTAIGYYSLYNNTGSNNTATGSVALKSNTTGSQNTANGVLALLSNQGGQDNTALGYSAMQNNTSGNENTAVGEYALSGNGTGNDLTAVGYGADVYFGTPNLSNSSAFGYGALITASNQVRIGNGDVTSIGGYVNWSNISDGRVKKNIKANVPGLAFINKLNAVTYNLDIDAANKITGRSDIRDKNGKAIMASAQTLQAQKIKEQIVYSGFIAQDVEKAAKSLNYNFSGVDAAKSDKDLYGLRYAEFVVPLVKAVQELSKQNEDLKTKVDAQQSINADLQRQINEMKAMISGTNAVASKIPGTAMLAQNVPNPFNNSTTINYVLPEIYTSAKIIVSDKSGKALKEVNITAKGKGSLEVNADLLAAGAYNYSLYVDGKLSGTKQMIVAR